MIIKKFFKEANDKKIEMQKALKKYVEATEDFYTLTGVQYSSMPKAKGKVLGFDDLMANIEALYNTYLEKKKDYDKECESCMNEINKLDNQVYRLIIEYSFIDDKKDKDIIGALLEFHNMDYSYSHFRKLKGQATKEFKSIIQ